MRQQQRRIYKRSELQDRRRKAFVTCIAAAKHDLTPQQIARWTLLANNHPRPNRKGKMVRLTWVNLFISINIHRAYNLLPLILDPPASL